MKWLKLITGQIIRFEDIHTIYYSCLDDDSYYSHCLTKRGETLDFLDTSGIFVGEEDVELDGLDVSNLNSKAVEFIEKSDQTVIEMSDILPLVLRDLDGYSVYN